VKFVDNKELVATMLLRKIRCAGAFYLGVVQRRRKFDRTTPGGQKKFLFLFKFYRPKTEGQTCPPKPWRRRRSEFPSSLCYAATSRGQSSCLSAVSFNNKSQVFIHLTLIINYSSNSQQIIFRCAFTFC
jgi:hypothetical protein